MFIIKLTYSTLPSLPPPIPPLDPDQPHGNTKPPDFECPSGGFYCRSGVDCDTLPLVSPLSPSSTVGGGGGLHGPCSSDNDGGGGGGGGGSGEGDDASPHPPDHCIPALALCDGVNTCKAGEDEAFCGGGWGWEGRILGGMMGGRGGNIYIYFLVIGWCGWERGSKDGRGR